MIQLCFNTPQQRMHGFSHFWGMYVTGFNPREHCLKCLLGHRSKKITRIMACDGAPIAMDETDRFDYLYLCGVSREWSSNFHLVLRPQPGTEASAETFNGITVAAHGAAAVPIPWLEDGFRGLPRSFTTCRNFQFGQAAYGALSCSSAAA